MWFHLHGRSIVHNFPKHPTLQYSPHLPKTLIWLWWGYCTVGYKGMSFRMLPTSTHPKTPYLPLSRKSLEGPLPWGGSSHGGWRGYCKNLWWGNYFLVGVFSNPYVVRREQCKTAPGSRTHDNIFVIIMVMVCIFVIIMKILSGKIRNCWK